jgi:lysophospholipase L1-like esterase
MVSQLRAFCSSYRNLAYLDYSKFEKTYGKTNLFKDNTHLNYEGAKLFSQSVAQDLRKIFSDKKSLAGVKKSDSNL